MPIRLLITDDHAVFRSGVRAFLERDGEFAIVGEAGSGAETLHVLGRSEVDVLLLDLNLPGQSGVQVARDAVRLKPKLRILVLTMHEDERYLHEVFRLGVCGFLLKKSSGTALIDAIRAVHRGERYVDAALAGNLEASRVGRNDGSFVADGITALTAREREVAGLLAWGHTNPEIAAKLHISERTVETHRANLMAKLGLATRAELVRFAVRSGLLDLT